MHTSDSTVSCSTTSGIFHTARCSLLSWNHLVRLYCIDLCRLVNYCSRVDWEMMNWCWIGAPPLMLDWGVARRRQLWYTAATCPIVWFLHEIVQDILNSVTWWIIAVQYWLNKCILWINRILYYTLNFYLLALISRPGRWRDQDNSYSLWKTCGGYCSDTYMWLIMRFAFMVCLMRYCCVVLYDLITLHYHVFTEG